jgi:hypothetical protein
VGELLARVIPLALGAAVSPTMLTVSVLILCSRRRPVARGVVFTLGVLTVLVALTVLGLTVLDRFANHHPSATERAVSDGVDLALGIVLLALALRTALRPHDPTRHAQPKQPRDRGSGLGNAFVLGLVVMATNVTTIVLYIPMMKDIGRSSVSEADQLLTVLLVLALASLPAWLPLTLRVIAPEPSTRALARLEAFTTKHRGTIILVVEVVFGLYLLLKGLGV